MSVPYAGFKGDYQTTVVLTPTANGFPWLAKLSAGNFTNQPAGATYTLANGDIPYFLMHLDHLSRQMKLEVFDAVSGKAWYKVSDDDYVTRNSTPGGFFAFAWDGVTFRGIGRQSVAGEGRAERPVRREAVGAEGARRREQPGALGDLDLAGDHHRASVARSGSRGRALRGPGPTAVRALQRLEQRRRRRVPADDGALRRDHLDRRRLELRGSSSRWRPRPAGTRSRGRWPRASRSARRLRW